MNQLKCGSPASDETKLFIIKQFVFLHMINDMIPYDAFKDFAYNWC